MCAVGQSQNTSIASAMPNSTLLGAASVGGSGVAGPLIKRSARGGVAGTLLGGAGSSSGAPATGAPSGGYARGGVGRSPGSAVQKF